MSETHTVGGKRRDGGCCVLSAFWSPRALLRQKSKHKSYMYIRIHTQALLSLSSVFSTKEVIAIIQQPHPRSPRSLVKTARFVVGRSTTDAGDLDLGGDHDGSTGLELPSDLLLEVKSGGLQRMEAEARELHEADEIAEAEAALDLAGRARRAPKVQDLPRRWVKREGQGKYVLSFFPGSVARRTVSVSRILRKYLCLVMRIVFLFHSLGSPYVNLEQF